MSLALISGAAFFTNGTSRGVFTRYTTVQDGYIAIAVLLWSLRALERLQGQLLQLAAWAYLSGKFYTLVFVRLDPARDTSEPIFALTLLLAEALIGLLIVGLCLRAGTPGSSR